MADQNQDQLSNEDLAALHEAWGQLQAAGDPRAEKVRQYIVAQGNSILHPTDNEGALGKAWNWANQGLISKDTVVRALSGRTPDQLKQDTEPSQWDTPSQAAGKAWLRGATLDTGDIGSSLTSPVSVATMAAGGAGGAGAIPKAAEALGASGKALTAAKALGTAGKVASTAAAAGFGVQGAAQAAQAAAGAANLEPNEVQKFLTGSAMAAGGAAGVTEGVAPKIGGGPIAELPSEISAKAVNAGDHLKTLFGDSVKPLDELTGTAPQRLSELKQFPQQVESIRQSVVDAEKQAHQAASDAFPKFDEPIPTGKMLEVPSQGPIQMSDFGEVSPMAKVPETTTFKDLQEQRSNLLQDITQEKRMVAAGNAPRFDLARMYEKLNGIDDTMSQAAVDQGGPEGLAKLQEARKQFGQYMNDFHNTGSPLRKILDARPGETQKVVGQFLSPDNGARAVETLSRNGADVAPIKSLIGQGDRPLRVTTAEAAKLRKAGSTQDYTTQRLRESLRQAQVNELPSSAQARLPQGAMRNSAPGLLKQFPVLDRLTPRNVTAFRLKRALSEKPTKTLSAKP